MDKNILKSNYGKNDILKTLDPNKLKILEKISAQINTSGDKSLESIMSSIKPEDLPNLLDIVQDINPQDGPISASELKLAADRFPGSIITEGFFSKVVTGH